MKKQIVQKIGAFISASAIVCTQLSANVPLSVSAVGTVKQTDSNTLNLSLGSSIAVKEGSILYGDANCDNMVDFDDVALIENYAAKRTNTDTIDIIAADVDLDGSVTLRDAEILYMYDNMRSAGNTLDLPYKGEVKWQTYPDPANYQIINEGMTWDEAENYCESLGGHLVTITSEFEQAQIEALIQAQTDIKNNYWLGLYKYNDEYGWVTDEKIDFVNWNPSSSFYTNYKAASIFGNSNTKLKAQSGKWAPMKTDCDAFDDFYGLANFGLIMEKDDLNASKYHLWKDETSLPLSGYWKLDCDVEMDPDSSSLEVDNYNHLELDLNGHELNINRNIIVQKNSELVIRDSSPEKTGVINALNTNSLFNVSGKLSIYGGTFNGSPIERGRGFFFIIDKADPTIVVKNQGCFDFYDGIINSNYNNALSLGTSSGVVNLIGGTISTITENLEYSLDNPSAIYVDEKYTGTLNITGTDIYADKGAGIYGTASNGSISISGGSIKSDESHGLYCTGDIPVNISGKVSVNGNNGGIYIPKDKKINISGKISSFDSSLFAEVSGTCTNGLSDYYSKSDIEAYLPQIKSNGKASVDDDGELYLLVSDPTITTTTQMITTTTTTTTKEKTTTSTTPQTTSHTTSQTTTAISTTSLPPVSTGIIDPQPPRKLNIEGKMEVKEMTLEEIIAAGISLDDPENYHVFNYEIKLTFGAAVISISNITIPELNFAMPTVSINGKLMKVVNYFSSETEEMYMIITGECKWLKEFYDVSLIVINKDTETLEDCSATINVPEGLTLVKSDETQKLGDLESGKAFETHWYVRGDEAGDYDLTSVFKGSYSGEEQIYNFKTENPLHVYAGDALKMKVIVPEYSFFDHDYPVTIVFENVSNKPIYNLEHTIKQVSQSSKITTRKYLDGECIEEEKEKLLQKEDVNLTKKIDKLEPGEKLVTEVVIHDIWRSILEKQIGDLKILTDLINLLTCWSKNPLLELVNAISGYCRATLEGMTVGHVLELVEVTTLEGSTTQVPYEVIIEKLPDIEKNDSVFNMQKEQLKYDMGLAMPERLQPYYYVGLNVDYARNVESHEGDEQADAQSELEKSYFYSQAVTSALDYKKIDYAGIGYGEILTDITTLGYDTYYRFYQPEGGVKVRFYVERVDGTRQFAPNSGIVKSTAEYDDFDIEIVDGKYSVDEEGKIILESNAVIKLTPKTANIKATIGAVSEDGDEVISIPLVVVDEHECNGEYVIIAPPENGEGAYIASFCDTCHELIECKQLSVEETAMLSNGKTYKSLSDVIADTENTDEELKLYIFGDVNIDEDVILPANIVPIITPDTNITVKDGCKFINNGEAEDYSSYNYNLSGNGPITTNPTTMNELIWGDANCDGQVDLSDAVLIMQSIANPNKYGVGGTSPSAITEKGEKQADVDTSTVGITGNDALKIQEFLLRLISSLEPSK